MADTENFETKQFTNTKTRRPKAQGGNCEACGVRWSKRLLTTSYVDARIKLIVPYLWGFDFYKKIYIFFLQKNSFLF